MRNVRIVERHGASSEVLEFARGKAGWLKIKASPTDAGPRFELRQDINTPPVLYALGPNGGPPRIVLDPNPALASNDVLGHAERIDGKLDSGQPWEGLLLVPPGFVRGKPYPLVIQSVYGQGITSEFTLYGYQDGHGLGPSVISPYAGRMFSTRGIVVLHLTLRGDTQMQTPQETSLRRQAFESAAKQLIAAGIADPARIGLLGFSRNGFYVEYTLTHSAFPFAAALAADHWDASYTAQTMLGYDSGGADVNGALPFGNGLKAWIERAPGFRADAVHTPLLQIEQSHALLGVLVKWELFSRLRYLHRPVEMYVVPNARFGVHNTQNPEQLIASQTHAIDWFCYWLKDEIDPVPEKRQQYERWSRLRAERDAPEALPVH